MPEILDDELILNDEIHQFKLKKQIRTLTVVAVILAIVVFAYIASEGKDTFFFSVGIITLVSFIILPIITLIINACIHFIFNKSFFSLILLLRTFLILFNLLYIFFLISIANYLNTNPVIGLY